jgi:hypothetical protein
MRKLDPIIARFVDDVLRLATEATRGGLQRFLAEEAEARRPRIRSARASRAVRAPTSQPKLATLAIAKAEVAYPAPAAEITDPQWLLAMGSDAPLDVEETEMAAEPVSEAPASSVRELGGASPIRLRANETLARVSGAGVVIRRAR